MSQIPPTISARDWRPRVRPVPGEPAGRATIGPANLSVVEMLRKLAAGDADLDPADVRACLAYAADVLTNAPLPPHEVVTLPPAADAAGEMTLPPSPAGGPAHHVAGYDLIGELGRGGMGVVYQARQIGLNRTVALKMILGGGHAGPKERARFRAEAEAVARLQHPNIVQVYEVGEQDGLPFLSLEYVPGGNLGVQVDGKPWPAKRAAALMETLARAVHTAHQGGVVHRDLKPGNILLTADGTPKIVDFGLAKRLESDGPTRTGEVMGTPEYMAPEQAAGRKDVGPSADVWALGAVLYELLTGRPPFRGRTPLDTILQVLEQEPAPVRKLNRAAGRDLETVCWKCLQRDPARRYASAAELAVDLRRFLDGEPIRAKAPGFWRRLNHRLKRLPETTSIGGIIVFFVLAAGMIRAEARVLICAALPTLAAVARVKLRPVIVGAIAGLVVVGALFLLAKAFGIPDPLFGFPVWSPWLIPPTIGLAAGVCRREGGVALFAYLAPILLLIFTVALSADYKNLPELPEELAAAMAMGVYFGGLGRIVAWWTDGSIVSAIFGALGGLIFGFVMFGIVSAVILPAFGKARYDWLLQVAVFVCLFLGTFFGALLGARRKRRNAG